MDKVIDIIRDFFKFFDEGVSVETEEFYGQKIVQVKSVEAKRLIGKNGSNLKDLERLLRLILEKQGIEEKFSIDIDDYKKRKLQDIVDKAKLLASRARSLQIDVEMPNLSAYERLIVHAALANEANIKTESEGEGRNRRLIIKYMVA